MCQENANNSDKPYVSWYWQDDDSNYKEFSHEASRQIEAAYSQKSIALVQGKDNRAFLVDTTKMMKINERTRYTRRVRRGDS
ncbi:unnamed protein product [Blepharisma stoltei]|uniref:WWE domain-containing protein n=1 Tax=Blepharisma stoltei TaxID=1481888 RepID=A0AAU9K421_9CILI|nr:unnamed protein product [Blepharisma stoltei]